MPSLVDEVLLHKPAWLVGTLDHTLPARWQTPLGYVLCVLVLTMGLRLATLVLQVWQQREFTQVAKSLIFTLRERLLRRLERVSMAEYEALGGGTVASHLTVDLATIDQFTGETLSRLLVAVLTLVGAATVLLWMHWQLGLFILVMNPVTVYFTVLITKRTKELKKRENAALQAFQEALTETLEAIHQLRAANRERHYLNHVIDLAREIRVHAAAFSWRSDAASRLSFAVFLIGIDGFRAVAMLMVAFSSLTLGQMIAVFGYLWFMLTPVDTLFSLQVSWQAARAALERVNRLLALAQEPLYPARRNPFEHQRTNALSLRDIRFRYGEGPLVLDGINLDIARGERVALVGASGGGKSTLVQVILGLYPPVSGDLLIDGISVREIGFERVRAHIGTVLQHPALFNDTVRNNLTLGVPHDDAALWSALGDAELGEFVKGMPQGLESIIGRDGIRLSGGQRQRLAIARLLLADPNIVILDEATSALDQETEARIHDAIRRRLAGRTMLIVAHRLSAVKEADRVCVFDAGQIVEHGHHEQLVQQGGVYERLYGER
jgi:ATP-binding cassette subfamily C protein